MASDDDAILQLVDSLQSTTIHDGSETSIVQFSGNKNWEQSLMVKVLSSDQTVRLEGLQGTLMFIWGKYGICRVSQVSDAVFMVEFASMESITQVILDGPWSFNNDFLLLQRMKPNLAFKDYTFPSIDLWIQLHDLPNNQLTPAIIGNLLHNYGELFPIDPLLVQQWVTFARVRVQLPVNFKLMKFARSPTEDGQMIVASLKYERLHRYCNVCCSLGHVALTCSTRNKIFQAAHKTTDANYKRILLNAILPKLDDSIKVSGVSSVVKCNSGSSSTHSTPFSETSTGFNPTASLQVCTSPVQDYPIFTASTHAYEDVLLRNMNDAGDSYGSFHPYQHDKSVVKGTLQMPL